MGAAMFGAFFIPAVLILMVIGQKWLGKEGEE